MKKCRKLLGLIITAALIASLTLPAYAETENSSSELQSVGVENNANMKKNITGAEKYQGEEPDITAAARHKITKLPDAGTYKYGQLLVKVGHSDGLQAESTTFNGVAESAEPLFSISDNSGASFESADNSSAEWYLVKLKADCDMLSDWNALLSENNVLEVEPDYIVHSEAIDAIGSNDPYEHAQTWLEQMKAPEAWAELPSGKVPGNGVTVAVIDSGVDMTHKDLINNLWSDSSNNHGYDFVDNNTNPSDDNGHGTHVAGIIAASQNSLGTVGVAYGAKIMAVKVLNAKGSGTTSNIIKGIEYAATNNANIINLSLGGLGGSHAYSDDIQELSKKNILVVAAAGNEGLPTDYAGDNYYGAYANPANVPGVLTVMAMADQPASNGDWLAKFSNYDADPGAGYEYELMAPGVNVLSTRMGGGYTFMSGTSMACPTVAGAAAVLMGLGCDRNQTWRYLVNSGTVMQGKTQPDNKVRSYHALDLQKALGAEIAGTTYSPVIANANITAKCDSVNVDGTQVALGNLNTTGHVYFQGYNFISTLNLTLENLGDASGTVTVSGTVGGATARGSVTSIGDGTTATIQLTLTQTPIKAATVPVNLTITPSDSNGNLLSPISFSCSLPAYDFTLPSGIYLSDGKYRISSTTVTVGGNSNAVAPILCLPHDFYIGAGQTLTFQGGIIYESNGAKIEVASGGNAALFSDMLLSNGNFRCTYDGAVSTDDNPNLFLGGCFVLDPDIGNAKYVDETEFYGSGASGITYENVGSAYIYSSGFYAIENLSVSCRYFAYNLMNQCVATTLNVAQVACFNSFVDNGEYLSDRPLQPLTVFVPDYQQDPLFGFWDNCVVGPITVRKDASTLALISNVYYQRVNANNIDLGDGDMKSVLPSETPDTITCASGSYFYSDVQTLLNSGDKQLCPAFVISLYSTGYTTDGMKIPHTLVYYFSTQLESGCPLYCSSPTDPFCYGQDLSSGAVFSGNSCTLNLSTDITDKRMTEYYELGGYYTKTYTFDDNSQCYYWATSMGEQSLFCFPAKFEFYTGLDVSVSTNASGNPVLTWPTDDYLINDYAEICRSVNGGIGELIATVKSTTNPTYTDSGVTPGNKYTYEVDLIHTGVFLTGSVDFAINSPQTTVRISPANTSQSTSTLSIGCDKAMRFAELEIGISYDENTFNLNSISFSDEVKNSGLPYGIIKTGTGQAVLTVGQTAGSEGVLPACNLAVISETNSDSSTDLSKISLSSVKVDGIESGWTPVGCSFVINSASSKLSYSDDGSTISMWRQTGDSSSVMIAEYDGSGKMLQILTPSKGANSDIAAFAAQNIKGKRLSVFYLDGTSGAPLRKNAGITLPS